MNAPVGVALDSQGNIYVANNGSNSITQYSAAGVQNTNFSITDGVSNPWAITIDAVNDLWVSNLGGNYVSAYTLLDSNQWNHPLSTVYLNNPSYGITSHGGDLEVGSVNFIYFGSSGELLTLKYFDGVGGPNVEEALALATDSAGNLYAGMTTGVVTGPQGILVTVNFAVEGIAVDSARGRVYLSNQSGNQVVVYSLKGVRLRTIQ